MLKESAHTCHGIDISKEIAAGCRVRLDVKVSKEESSEAYRKAVKEVSKRVDVPGFRRGKAPQKIIEGQYKEHVDQEWKRELRNAAMHHAISHVDEKPLGGRVEKADLENVTLEGATLHLEYEMEPISPLVDISDFAMKEEPTEEITEEDVQRTLDRLRQYHAQWNEITDRPVKEGDWVALEIECQEPKMILCSDTQFQIKKGEVANWILELVVGKGLNDTVEGESVQDVSDEEVEGLIDFKPAKYKLKIQKIREPVLPEMNGELAKKLGAESVEELLKKVKINLENETKLHRTHKLREQLGEFLCQKYPLELPQSLAEYEKNLMLQNRIEAFLERGITEAWVKENMGQITEDAEKMASTRLRLIYILRNEAEKMGIKVLVSDLQREMLYEQYVRPADERITHPQMKEEEREGRLYFTLLAEKTLDRMLENRQIA